MNRAYNFNAGPAALPEEVLMKAQNEWLNIDNSGMSIMELSHRSKTYDKIHEKAHLLLRSLLEIPDDYEILFLQGGASLQFSMVPYNLLQPGYVSQYILTGSWSEKAHIEAQRIGRATIIESTQSEQYRSIPKISEITINEDHVAYVHLTSNNTIYGTQWQTFPNVHNGILVADMSSDILSKKISVDSFGLIYAGAQKNLGPSGVTVVIIQKELLKRSEGNSTIPTMLNYNTHAKNRSLYNTPPTLSIYLLSLVLEWIENQGGISVVEKKNNEKAKLLYDVIDESNGFYTGHAEVNSRSLMNITFTLKNDELTKAFLSEAKEAGFVGLNGHRSIGGCRASIYNAVPTAHCEVLAQFMRKFRLKY